MDLFDSTAKHIFQPLADKMRPISFDNYFGQEHIIGKNKPLRKMIESDNINSIILWGPPGSGKTSLARLIAKNTNSHFEEFSAVSSGVNDIRKIIKEAQDRIKFYQKKTIFFIDEIHRFNKSQQDAFLPYIENGTIVLIGATTENPSFEINAPLISRSQVFVLNSLKDDDIKNILLNSLKIYPSHKIDIKALEHIIKYANGDARTALNALEFATAISKKITLKIAEEAVQKKALLYDKKGDSHYDVISAFIKSMRASNADATLHYLARMIKSGEDPMFIARRMVIFASEDIGNALPTALVVATNAMQSIHMIGMPEASIILAQVSTYLASCPKSTNSYDGLIKAMNDIDENKLDPVPLHLRNATTNLMKDLGYGKDHVRYPYKKSKKSNNVPLEYMPDNLKGRKYYEKPKKTI